MKDDVLDLALVQQKDEAITNINNALTILSDFVNNPTFKGLDVSSATSKMQLLTFLELLNEESKELSREALRVISAGMSVTTLFVAGQADKGDVKNV